MTVQSRRRILVEHCATQTRLAGTLNRVACLFSVPIWTARGAIYTTGFVYTATCVEAILCVCVCVCVCVYVVIVPGR